MTFLIKPMQIGHVTRNGMDRSLKQSVQNGTDPPHVTLYFPTRFSVAACPQRGLDSHWMGFSRGGEMPDRNTLRAEFEEQRCLIERQQIEILRHKHHIEMQRRRMAHLEAELQAIAIAVQRAAPIPQATKRSASNGNGHRAARQLSSETISSGDQL